MIFIFLFSFTSFVFASVEDCKDFEVTSIAKEIGIPNCLKPDQIKLAKEGSKNNICTNCKDSFLLKSNKSSVPMTKDEKQKEFFNLIVDEYQKNVTTSLMNVIKLRGLEPTGSTYPSSQKSCQKKTLSDFEKDCSSKTAIAFMKDKKFFEEIDTKFTNEVAKIISKDPAYDIKEKGFLKRVDQTCFIAEKDALLMSVSATEEALNPKIIESLLKINNSKATTIEDLFDNEEVSENYDGDVSELVTSFEAHPFLSQYTKSPQIFLEFLKKIERPATTENLRKAIYNQASGNAFDKKLSESCNNSFNELKKSLCTPDFENKNIDLDGVNNYAKLYGKSLSSNSNDLASTDKSIEEHLNIFRVCEPPKETKANLTLAAKNINKDLSERYSDYPIKQFELKKYELEIGYNISNLCRNPSSSCSENNIVCKLQKNFKDLQNKDSRIYRLANSSNTEVNNLLQSMIGDASNIDQQTRTILVSNGILPKPDGTIVPQPEVPERKPAQYASAIQKQQSSQTRTASSISPTSHSNQAMRQENSQSNDDYSSSATSLGSSSTAQTSSSTSEMFDNLKRQEEELKGVQDEIRRRLSEKPNKKPSSLKEAREIAADSFRSRGRSFTPEQINSYAEEMMSPRPQQNVAASQFAESNQNQSVTSGGETKAEKFKKEQANRALMGMAGAQQSALNDNKNPTTAQEAAGKDLTKVALNITDDPKVNLSETFNKKLDPNDPETKVIKDLLKKQSNFLLQLNSINFKVVFTDKNSFNLLFESGDKKEAERIRPQLEMFLNKIKRNNTLHNLSQSWST